MKPNRRHSGFTLMELLLALAMAAVLSLSLYTTFNVANRARRTAEQTAAATRAGSVAMELICRDLESVVLPPNPAITTLTTAGPFQGQHRGGGGGDNDDLFFSTLNRDEFANAESPLSEGVYTVEYYLKADRSGSALIRRVNRNPLAPTQQEGEEQLLCRNVRSLSFQYFDQNSNQAQTDWDSTLLADSYPAVLPVSVQVSIVLDDPQTARQANGTPPVWRLTRVVPLALGRQTPPDTTATQ